MTKKEKKKPVFVKTSLNTPYRLQWSCLDQADMHFILSVLKEKLSELGLHKREVKGSRRWFSKKKEACTKGSEEESAGKVEATSKALPEDKVERGWTNVGFRKQLAIGINEVTRGLEKNDLCLVLVCKSIRPAHMSAHLILLSRTRAVPACQVPRLSESLAGPLGLKHVLALGVRRSAEAFSQAVAAIVPRVPPLHMAWLPVQTAVRCAEAEATDDGDQARGQKRKLEAASLGREQTEQVPKCTLEHLRVKRIVPNPTKVRKLKNVKRRALSK
ncbi:ribonuclease P protein subunit p38 [Brienomyrus brachyistius]|uniref:ribonuclease P protein subunit p38 n=1 Tax=Brienomyrus brachyistius TaxID=42636 RepID=UPI0020B2DFEC|nr:ribonuclease P protein subunit p38 [Brienomyrus brachyistius]XP_048881173.1 ribonuclease P protein subunit p38 [Brienomyrus brachyistius]